MVLSVERYPGLRWSPAQLVAIGSSSGLLFPPGRQFLYSNTNYALLTMIAERASGRSLGQLLRTRIFEPLGLRNTTYRPLVNWIPRPFVSGYTIESGGRPVDATRTSPTIAFGAGAIVSTQRDALRFFHFLIAGRLLPRPWLREMEDFTPQSLATEHGRYGYGLGLEETKSCGTNYGHAGGFPGYLSLTEVTPDASGSFTVYTNASPKIGSSAPFPAKITAAFEHAKDVLRCAIHGR
jgi:D-alanyl-D-alanine carboxypeptidase